jgi:hypothetical protein
MSTFSIVLLLLFGGGGLRLFQFVAILSRLMRRQRADASATEGITDTSLINSYPAADSGVILCPPGLSRLRHAHEMSRRRTHAAGPGSLLKGQRYHSARQASRRRSDRPQDSRSSRPRLVPARHAYRAVN